MIPDIMTTLIMISSFNGVFADLNEIQEDPIVEQNDTPRVHDEPRQITIAENAFEQIKSYFKPSERADIDDKIRQDTQSVFMSMNDGNMSLDTSKSFPDSIVSNSLTVEARITDVTLKSICTNVESIVNSLGYQINTSDALAKEWKDNISNLDSFIKTLKSWKRTTTVGLCLITLGVILWKMGAMRAIPNFLSNLISLMPIPTPRIPSNGFHGVGKDIPLPSTKSFQAIMESPLTPLTIVTGVGIVTIGLGALKLIAWTLIRIPK